MRIFKCNKCGKISLILKDSASVSKCCEEVMIELVANTVDAAVEKHVPVVTITGKDVTAICGEVSHPMEEKHYIEFMIMETSNGYQVHNLKPSDEPKCTFALTNEEKLIAVYAYCNLHGLWKSK